MSIMARTTYLATKVNTVQIKLQPIIETYEKVKTIGVENIASLTAEISELMAKLGEAILQANEWVSKKSDDLVKWIEKRIERLTEKLNKLTAKVTEIKDKAIASIEKLVADSMSGVSGVELEVDITPSDPITGEGGSISLVPTPKLFDESTLLVDQTLTDPTTVITSTVVGTSVSGGAVTAIGVANGMVVP